MYLITFAEGTMKERCGIFWRTVCVKVRESFPEEETFTLRPKE